MTTESVSIVFTDVVGSTELLSRLGDEVAETLRRRHMSQLREVIAAHGGREVKALGDGLMIAFAVPSAALAATVDMQRAVERHNVDADEPLSIRIGVATGECDVDGLDLHGTAVVEAARLCDVAEGGQILVTDMVRTLAGARRQLRFDERGPTELKGIARRVVVHELLWVQPDRVEPRTSLPVGPRSTTSGDRGAFAVQLRRLRESTSLTQEELAERAGLSAKAVGALERGERRRPHPNTVRVLSEALGLDEAGRAALVEAARGADPARPVQSVGGMARIPAPPTPTIGRHQERTEILAILREGGPGRLVTLTGPGGVGKTRIAWDVATELREDGSAPVPVELAPVRGSEFVMPTIARAVGVQNGSDVIHDVLASVIGDREQILVLDNFEHVLDAAQDVASLLARCPGLRILVTSRAPLRIRAEQEYPIRPLSLPSGDDQGAVLASAAGRLFVDRVKAAAPDVSLDREAAASISAICRRLDGLPLAIELVAAHARYVGFDQLLDRLDRALGDGRVRDLPPRQQTIQATLDWSLDLCTEDEQRLLGAVSVFAGGFDLDAVEVVAGPAVADPPVALDGLVEQSLLISDGAVVGGRARYRLLEPVRNHTTMRLTPSETRELATRHAAHFASVTSGARSELWGTEQADWLARLTREHANTAVALNWLIDQGELTEAAAILADVWLYWALRGHAGEGMRWAERVMGAAGFARLESSARAGALVASAGLRLATGDNLTAIRQADSATTLAHEAGDEPLHTEALVLVALASLFAGDSLRVTAVLDQLERLMTPTTDGWLRAGALTARGQHLVVQGDLAAATPVLAEAEAVARETTGPFTLAWVLNVAATVAALEGNDDVALDRLVEAASIAAQVETTWTLVYTLPGLAGLASRRDAAELAATLFAAGAAIVERSMVTVSFGPDAEAAATQLELVRRQLDPGAFDRAWVRGRGLNAGDILELVRPLSDAPAPS